MIRFLLALILCAKGLSGYSQTKDTVIHGLVKDRVYLNGVYSLSKNQPEHLWYGGGGLALGFSKGLVSRPFFQFGIRAEGQLLFKLADRFYNVYYHPDDLPSDRLYNYVGWNAGPYFIFGNVHQLELWPCWGQGQKFGGKFDQYESRGMAIDIRYAYDLKNGIVPSVGAYLNREMFNFSAGVAYQFQTRIRKKLSGDKIEVMVDREKMREEDEIPKEARYNTHMIGVAGQSIIGAAGFGIRYEFYRSQSRLLMLGFAVESGVHWLTYELHKIVPFAAGTFQLLAGRKAHKFEFGVGVTYLDAFNWRTGEDVWAIKLWTYPVAAIGYRYMPERVPVSIRTGISVPNGFYLGVNFRLNK